jgi:hypothetical protein
MQHFSKQHALAAEFVLVLLLRRHESASADVLAHFRDVGF